MNITDFLAKSDGTKLIDHSIATCDVALEMAKNILNQEIYDKYEKIIICFSILHDIGKCIKTTQDYFLQLKNKNINKQYDDIEIEISNSNFKYYHNEIGYAILYNIFDNYELEDTKYIYDAIFWHHVKINNEDNTPHNISNIIESLSDDDIENIKLFFNHCKQVINNKYKLDLKLKTKDSDIFDIKTKKEETRLLEPVYISEEQKNELYILFRSILISADRYVSKVQKVNSNINNEYLSSKIYGITDLNDIKTSYDIDSKRTKTQINISNTLLEPDYHTTIINAPAGFGKTYILIDNILKRKQKCIWVAPRNMIVENLFESIINEIEKLNEVNDNKIKITIETFLTNERKQFKSIGDDNITEQNIDEYNSDIVITNIDNYLNIITQNKNFHKSYSILNRFVVFDEYHEIISTEAMFACFINLMKIRHNYTKANTVLISATPNYINFMWEFGNDETKYTKYLPDKFNHYSAIHKIPYKIDIYKDSKNIQTVITNNNTDVLNMCNSVYNSQSNLINFEKTKNIDTILLHSYYTELDKNDIISKIFQQYSKNANNINNTKNVVFSAPILKASFDLSFKTLNLYLSDIDSFIQTIGRCNRWGEKQDAKLNIIIFDESDKHEITSISNNYNLELYNIWKNYIQEKLKNINEITLDELYSIYNLFYSSNLEKIKEINKNFFKESLKNFAGINPTYYINKINNKKVNSNTKITLRCSNNRYFVKYKIYSDVDRKTLSEYCEAFSEIKYGTGINQHDEDNYKDNYNELFKKQLVKNMEKLAKNAYNKDCAYPAFNHVYSKKYGKIKRSLLNE
jgi:CRISPR-associated endonuclease/helicase Cas3